MIARLRTARARVREEAGFSIFELLVVMVILGVVVGGLGTVFVSATNAETDLNRRFQAQHNARLALDALRREVHCANGTEPASPTTYLDLVLPSYCSPSASRVRWCTTGSGTHWRLYRVAPAPATPGECTGGVLWADHLIHASVFGYTPVTGSVPKLSVTLPVQLKTDAGGLYRLDDDIVLRNASRTT